MKMKWYYYIPFWFLSVISKTIRIFKTPAQDSTWDKYFGEGYNPVSFTIFMETMKDKTKETYWIFMLIPYGFILGISALIFSIIAVFNF